jgi:hypothetical protein
MGYFVVDRFEGSTAVIIADDGREFTAPRRVLPEGSDEGTVLRLNLDNPITGDWSSAQIDDDERNRRMKRERRTFPS